jgi:hypothetical protein
MGDPDKDPHENHGFFQSPQSMDIYLQFTHGSSIPNALSPEIIEQLMGH